MFDDFAKPGDSDPGAAISAASGPARGPEDADGLVALLASALRSPGTEGLTSATVEGWAVALGGQHDDDARLSEAELVERISASERLKAAAAARQARDSVLLEQRIRERRAVESAAARTAGPEGVGQVGERVVEPSAEAGHAIALARGESPSKGSRLLGLAKALVRELPHTLNALGAGLLNEWRATLVARETACLDVADRVRVDEAMVAVYARGGVGDRQLAAETRAHAQRLDPAAAVKRARRAVSERRVSVRPAPDSMAYLTCLLPAPQAVAAYKALAGHADSARASGPRGIGTDGGATEERTRDQIMADTLVERITGQQRASGVPVTVNLVMSDAALLAGRPEPAVIPDYGVIPAQIARDLVLDDASSVALRRLYTPPASGALTAMESRARAFPEGLKTFIAIRDAVCLTPWCGAPIRQTDHIVAAARGGPTRADNGQGLCEHCNQVKEAPGWASQTVPATRHTVTVTTPTGHRYSSTAPPLPGTREIIGHRVEFPGGEYVFHTAA